MSDKSEKFYKVYPDVIYSHRFFSLPEKTRLLYLYICLNTDRQNIISGEMVGFLSLELAKSIPENIFGNHIGILLEKNFITEEK